MRRRSLHVGRSMAVAVVPSCTAPSHSAVSTGRKVRSSQLVRKVLPCVNRRWRCSRPSLEGYWARPEGRAMAARWLIVVALIGALTVTACSSGNPHQSLSPSAPTPTHSRASSDPITTGPSSPSYDPKVKPAVDAYQAFSSAAFVAEQRPPGLGAPLPEGGDFTKYSFDPIKGDLLGYVTTLNRTHQAWRGTPPTPRISVLSTDLSATPYPTITLDDCPTPAPTWEQYDVSTGAVATTQPGAAPPPYLITAQVIYYENHWGVSKIAHDSSRTCHV